MRRVRAFLLDHWAILGVILILVGLLTYFLAAAAPVWFWHPLGLCTGSRSEVIRCKSYNFFSGSFSDISEITLPLGGLIFALGWWHQHNCHVSGCPRLQWHAHPDHGHPVCKSHHPHDGSDLLHPDNQ